MSCVTGNPTNSALESPAGGVRILREALDLLWRVADPYTKRRLLLALVLVAGSALLAALTPIALKLAIDALSGAGRGGSYATPVALVLLYIAGQYLVRAFTELRMLMHGQAEQRVRRHLGRRLFEHLVRLPLRFHLERKTGAMGQIAEQGLHGYQLLLTHLVYTIVPVVVEFVAVASVLLYLNRPLYVGILGIAALAPRVAARNLVTGCFTSDVTGGAGSPWVLRVF